MSRRKNRQTLSLRLITIFVSLLGIILLGTLLLTGLTLRSYLIGEVDKSLESSGKFIARQTVDKLINGSQEQILPNDFYFYLDINGQKPIEIINTQVLDTYGRPNITELQANTNVYTPTTITGTKFRSSWRIMTVELQSKTTNLPAGTITVASPLTPTENTVENVIRRMSTMALIIVTAGSLLSYFLIHRSLKPLRDIEGVAQAVADGDLATRVPDMNNGSEVGLLGNSINVMLGQIEKTFNTQKQAEQKMRHFVSNASHELRTPLSTIRGYAELHRLGGIPAEQTEHAFERIESEATRMATLVEDLLQLARLDEGRALNISEVNLTTITQNVVGDFLVRAPERQAKVLPLEGSEIPEMTISADENLITQVLTNLLANVITHTPEKTSVEIAIGHSENPDFARIEVRDHGKGIAEKERTRVFERFYRTDASRSRESGGTGLGLAIVAAIIRAHKGTASILETPGGGTTVCLEIPIDINKNNVIADIGGNEQKMLYIRN